MNSLPENCYLHGKIYQLIGNDPRCDLNCQICCDCLQGVDNPHKKGVSNHQTISIEQLNLHFDKLKKYSSQPIQQCQQAVDKYFRSFETLLRQQINRQKARIAKIVHKILLTGITKDQKKLDVIIALHDKDFGNVKCKQVGEISQELFSYVPKGNSFGFKKFHQYINNKQNQIFNDFKEIVQSKTWHKTFLKDCEKDISFPDFEEPIRASRVKTEQDSPKKTLRRSIRRQQKKVDLKDLTVQLKKPLQLIGSKLIQGRQESTFLAKLLDHRHVISSQLLYRASEHAFSIKEFHKLCDNEHNTIVLVKTQFNKIIGGFTPIPWRSTANTLHSDVRSESFLFSLSLKQKMNLIDQKSAIFNSVNFGPTFGAGADLAICHNGNVQKTSYSQFPYSYANSRYKQSNQHSTSLFTGQKNGNHFLLKQWEVWRVNFAQ